MLARIPVIAFCVFVFIPTTIFLVHRNTVSFPSVLGTSQSLKTPEGGVTRSWIVTDDGEVETIDLSKVSSPTKETHSEKPLHSDAPSIQVTSTPSDEHSNIVQVGLLAKNAPKDAAESQIEYGKKWGYATEVLQDRPHVKDLSQDLTRKQRLHLLSVLADEMGKPEEDRAKWISSFDSQHVTTNDDIPLSTFLPPRDFLDIHFLATKHEDHLNPNVFLVRVSEWAQRLLTSALAKAEFDPDNEGRPGSQDALEFTLRKTDFAEHVVYLPETWFQHSVTASPKSTSTSSSTSSTDSSTTTSTIELKRSHSPSTSTSIPALVKSFWRRLRQSRSLIREVNFTLGSYFATKSSSTPTSTSPAVERAMQDLDRAHARLLEVLYARAEDAEAMESARTEVVRALSEARGTTLQS